MHHLSIDLEADPGAGHCPITFCCFKLCLPSDGVVFSLNVRLLNADIDNGNFSHHVGVQTGDRWCCPPCWSVSSRNPLSVVNQLAPCVHRSCCSVSSCQPYWSVSSQRPIQHVGQLTPDIPYTMLVS